ncbi:MAG: slipin family protein [Deltaproteobacteria bacterium]|nr:slipin family protein [Deltaproteobacteria bacterium]
MKIHVDLGERALLYQNHLPVRYLEPGCHRVLRPFVRVSVRRLQIDGLLAELRPEERLLIPETDLKVLRLGAHERAVVAVGGRPVRWLGEGEHQIWTVDPSVEIRKFGVAGVEAEPLAELVKMLVPAGEYVEVVVPNGWAGIRYVDGEVDRILPSGRHSAWSVEKKVSISVVDLRRQILNISGQEVMTRDRVTLRLNVAVSFHVADPLKAASVAKAPEDVIYLAVQLAIREAVAAQTLDQLLVERNALADVLSPEVRSRAESVGLAVHSLGVKDLILPGEMKTLLNRVIEAQKEAEANVILRREETAAVRSMANTAKVMAENPVILRLKELEAYRELSSKVERINVFVGREGLPRLNLLGEE